MSVRGSQDRKSIDVVVVGAGFAGMYLVRKLRDDLGLDVKVFERGGDVGGTWYWNRYPGLRCDVESVFYCYSFDRQLTEEWDWTERYPSQPEILRYLNHVADRFDLRRSISFNSTVVSAEYVEQEAMWRVTTDSGEVVYSRYFVAAAGCLSVPSVPTFPGLEDFEGEIYHTGQWPHEGVDFAGQNVAVIGTGSSGIQVIPEIAKQAKRLTVFQRTATYSVPARNRPLTDDERRVAKENHVTLRELARNSRSGMLSEGALGIGAQVDPNLLEGELERRWWLNGLAVPGTLSDHLVSPEANELISEFVRRKVLEIVKLEVLVALL